MTVIFATLDGANGFACAFDMGRSMGDCFSGADSIDRRNALTKSFCWRFEA